MSAWTTSDRVMKFRERWRVIDVVVEMLDGWRRHQAAKNASLLAFFTFLSIFPLLLAAITILGFVLENDPELRDRLIEGALSEIPVVGAELASDPQAIEGNWIALIVGLGTALWGATRAFVGLQSGLDDAWEVPLDERAGMPAQRGKALVGLAIIGGSQIVNVAIASIVNAAGLPHAGRVALLVATAVINIAVITTMFRFLTSASPSWRDVLPGGISAGLALSLLQYFGTALVKRFSEGNSEAFATASIVIGLLTWLSLIGVSVIMSAELNAAIKRLRAGPALPDEPRFRLSVPT